MLLLKIDRYSQHWRAICHSRGAVLTAFLRIVQIDAAPHDKKQCAYRHQDDGGRFWDSGEGKVADQLVGERASGGACESDKARGADDILNVCRAGQRVRE